MGPNSARSLSHFVRNSMTSTMSNARCARTFCFYQSSSPPVCVIPQAAAQIPAHRPLFVLKGKGEGKYIYGACPLGCL